MTEMKQNPSEQACEPEVVVAKRHGFSIVWLIPLVAALIGGWLAYRTLSEMGPTITITFETAAGLEAEKTKIKYKDVAVGLVESIEISEDLSHVIVTAQLHKEAESHLKERTRFWVVRPRIGATGISGLGALVSGAYIAVEPGTGDPERNFKGLELPPATPVSAPGLHLNLRAKRLGSLNIGSPVNFHQIRVGKVEGYRLAEDRQSVEVQIFIDAPHHKLVREQSRFWNAGGIDLSVSADGIRVKADSLEAMVAGGIAFETPSGTEAGKPSENGATFVLHDDHESIGESLYTVKATYMMYFEDSVRGLKPGAPVEFRGIKVGSVTDIRLEYDSQSAEMRIPVTVEIEPERIAGDKHPDPRKFMENLVARGLRGQLELSSLLTGQLFVEMELHPDSPPALIAYEGKYPKLPTVPTLTTELVNKLKKLPLDQLVNEVLQTVQGIERLVSSPELKNSIRNLDQTLQGAKEMVKNVNGEVVPLAGTLGETLAALRGTLAEAQGALKILDGESPVRYNLNNTLEELAGAARAIRVLAEYIERNPDALLFGKGKEGK